MSFDRLAPFYRGLEKICAGELMQRCRLAWLDEIRNCRNVLIAGPGPGRFLEICAIELPQARIVCVDASAAMLVRAKKVWDQAARNPRRAEFVHASLPEWSSPAAEFDLIATHFFLDCFSEPALSHVVAQLARAANSQVRWLISDFQIPDRGFFRWRAKIILALLYGFFLATTKLPARKLISPDAALRQNGFRLHGRRTFDWQLLRSDLWMRG